MPSMGHVAGIRDSDGQALENGIISVDEMIERHLGEWVLMRVTEYDDEQWPSKGEVLNHSLEQQNFIQALKDRVSSATQPGQSYYSFRAYPTLRSGPEYEAAVKEFVANPFVAERARSEPAAE